MSSTLPTGIAPLDGLIGGLEPGVTVIGARPAQGKSLVAAAIAVEAAKSGVGVLYVSMEMAAEQLKSRIVGREAGVDMRQFERDYFRLNEGAGGMTAEEESGLKATLAERSEAIAAAKTAVSHLPLYIEDCSVPPATGEGRPSYVLLSTRGVQEAAAEAARMFILNDTVSLGLIVVDYMQLLAPEVRRPELNRQEDIAIMSRDLNRIAVGLRVPVVLLAQLNRTAEEGRRPVLADLRESGGAVEADADTVMFLHRPATGEMEFVVAKHRGGPVGIVRTLVDDRLGTVVPA